MVPHIHKSECSITEIKNKIDSLKFHHKLAAITGPYSDKQNTTRVHSQRQSQTSFNILSE
ncbi:hypothetical protein CASFOL_039767 [Castilleja foliolosa]|uniref:Uncharacterized protein n=1 Tax=Castilleja foliolosa TaxID=1961234 RepID=A0ABD3BGF2_9LAMI